MGNRSIYTLIALLFFIVLFLKLSLTILAIVNVFLLLLSLISLKKTQNSIFTPFTIILACLYLFHCGHLWLTLIETDVEKWDFLFNYTATDELQESVYAYITQLLICFYLVGLYKLKPSLQVRTDCLKFSSTSLIFNIVFGIIYIICLYYDSLRAIKVAAVGYGLGYTYESGFAFTLSAFLNGLFIFMFLVNRNNRNILLMLILMVLLRVYIVMFLVGNRGSSIVFVILVVYILSKYTTFKTFFSNSAVIVVLVTLLTIFLPLISLTRNDTIQVNSISDFIIKYNPISYFLGEFGFTVKTVILAFQHDIPEFRNGAQFFYSSLAIFPASDAIFGSTYRNYVSISGELNHLESIRGLGGSLIANVYVNFGNSTWGYIAFSMLAYLTCWFSNKLNDARQSIYKFLLLFSMFAGMLTAVRGEWYDFVTQVKTMLYLILFLWCCSKLGIRLYK